MLTKEEVNKILMYADESENAYLRKRNAEIEYSKRRAIFNDYVESLKSKENHG